MKTSIGKWDIRVTPARQPWNHLRLHRKEAGRHFVWGRLSVVVEDGTAEVVPTCACCGSLEIGERFAGDEGWTVCSDCGAVEQGYRYVSRREAE
jgi:hypothetical protein